MIKKKLIVIGGLCIIAFNFCIAQNTVSSNAVTAYHDSIALTAHIVNSQGIHYLKYEITNRSYESIYTDTTSLILTTNMEKTSVEINTLESGSLHGEKKLIEIKSNTAICKLVKLEYANTDKFHITVAYLTPLSLKKIDNPAVVNDRINVGKIFYLENARVFEIANWIFWER